MAQPDPARLQQALTLLYERVVQDHRLAAEAQRARREFFGAAAAGPVRQPVRELRFCEWFLLERESDALGAVPAEAFDLEGDEAALRRSQAGVYRIQEDPDGALLARDLQSDDEPLELVAPGGTLRGGDLLVGRVYRRARDRWQPSAAVAVYRPGAALADALRKDLARLDLDRRLSQRELEHLLLQRCDAERRARPAEHVEAELEALFVEAGMEESATGVSAALRAAARPGPVIGPLLDHLAFDTQVDLDRARRLLVELWNTHHEGAEVEAFLPVAPEAGRPPAPGAGAGGAADRGGETLGERLVRALDAGLAAHEDVDELFARLEAMAGIEPEAEAEAEEHDVAASRRPRAAGSVAADEDEGEREFQGERDVEAGEPVGEGRWEEEDPTASAARGRAAADEVDLGDFAPLVQEYLWETSRGGTPAARTLELFVQLQRNAPLPRTDLEQVTGQDLMRWFLHVYLGAGPGSRAEAVRGAFEIVRDFWEWAERTQELPVRPALESCRGALLDHLDRLQAAGQALSSGRPLPGARPPALLRVEEVGADGFGVRSEDHSHWVAAAPATAALLRAGDLLLAAIAPGAAAARLSGLVVALPADADALIG